MQISDHFRSAEFERSQTAARAGITINIQPGGDVWKNVFELCAHVLEPLRAAIGDTPILISSGYRPPAVNQRVGGAPASQHVVGQAADIGAVGWADYDLAHQLYISALPFDQLIYEFGRWVHVSYNRMAPPRRDALTSYVDTDGQTHYVRGIRMLSSIEGAVR